jgi:hypothetical protein
MKPKAIFLFDVTCEMARPWLEAGFECFCFDGQHKNGITREGNLVKVGMYFEAYSKLAFAKRIYEVVGEGVCFVFGFPECTDLTNAGTRHQAEKRKFNPFFQLEAIELCDLVRCVAVLYGCPWGFENPKGAVSTQYRPYDFRFDPCDFGGYLPEDDIHPLYPEVYPPRDAYNKDTCIWCGLGFRMPKAKRIEPAQKENPGWKKCGGKSVRTKNIRSATPRGFAKAVFYANHKAVLKLILK